MEWVVKLESFEGSLDLLLHLIEKAEVDIYDIPIAEITEQYLHAIRGVEELELEKAADFLLMAARLLTIKSRMLLPQPQLETEEEGEEEDPRAALVAQLLEYQVYKKAAEALRQKEKQRSSLLSRPAFDYPPITTPKQLALSLEVSADELVLAWKRLEQLHRRQRDKKVQREPYTIQEAWQLLQQHLAVREMVSFLALIPPSPGREQVVTLFLAALEMARQKEVYLLQQQLFGEITLVKRQREEGSANAQLS